MDIIQRKKFNCSLKVRVDVKERQFNGFFFCLRDRERERETVRQREGDRE
jgi:hypothetical protein